MDLSRFYLLNFFLKFGIILTILYHPQVSSMGGCRDGIDQDRLLLSGDVEPNPGPPRRCTLFIVYTLFKKRDFFLNTHFISKCIAEF